MKHLLILFVSLSVSLNLLAQQTPCCQNKFTNFTIDQTFHIGSCLVPRAIRDKYFASSNGAIGRKDGGQFIVPQAYMSEILRIAYNPNNQCYYSRCIMELLGVMGSSWSDDTQWVRFDIKNLEELHISLPASTNPGADSLFVPGGFTICGIPERVIDQASLDYVSDSLNIRICPNLK